MRCREPYPTYRLPSLTTALQGRSTAMQIAATRTAAVALPEPRLGRSVQSAQSAESVSDGHGHDTMGTLPTDLPTQAPDRPHRHSHRNDGGRADRRMSHRAFRFALTCTSPHARTHARTHARSWWYWRLPSRCASWRAVRRASVYLKSAHAPRAAATLLVIAKATSRVRTYISRLHEETSGVKTRTARTHAPLHPGTRPPSPALAPQRRRPC